jgi:hypothetical protein
MASRIAGSGPAIAGVTARVRRGRASAIETRVKFFEAHGRGPIDEAGGGCGIPSLTSRTRFGNGDIGARPSATACSSLIR